MVDLTRCLTNLLFFDIPLLYCYSNLNSSIICCLSSGDMYLFFGTSISLLASLFFECNSTECSAEDFFETLVILSAFSFSIKSPVPFTGFLIAFFEAVFIASVVYFLALKLIA